jgi:hypothetical protein
MGQYYKIVNVDKKEFIKPSWNKLMEFGASSYGEMTGLSLLVMNPEDKKEYLSQIKSLTTDGLINLDKYIKHGTGSKSVVGRWAGDRIVIAGDYAEEGDAAEGNLKYHIYEGKETFTTLYDACGGHHAKGEGFKDITEILQGALYAHPYVVGVHVYDMICGYDWQGKTKPQLQKFMPESAINMFSDTAKRVGKFEHEDREKQVEGFIDEKVFTNHQDMHRSTTAAFINLDKCQYVKASSFGGAANLSGSILKSNFTQALAALLPNSNGRGGGDLHSDNPIVGTWSGDRIMYVDNYTDFLISANEDISDQVLTALFDDSYVRDEYIKDGVTVPKKELTTN